MKSQPLLKLCFLWLMRREQLLVVFLVMVVGISSLGVISSSFTTRKLYEKLHEIQVREDDIDSEYGKLLLEYSAWANYARVEQVSQEELNMILPSMEDMVLVKK